MSIQSQLVALAVAALQGAGGEAVVAYRCRMAAFKRAELPAINVIPKASEPEYNDVGSIDRRLSLEVRYTGVSIDEVDAAIDPIYTAGNAALLADPRWGGLATFTRELGSRWELEKGEVDTVALVVIYEIDFSTTRSDPSVSYP